MEKRATGDVTSRGALGSTSSSRCQTTRAPRLPSFDGPQVESARISDCHERDFAVGGGDGRSRLRSQPSGGARRDRTDDLLLAKQALSQLSYGPDQRTDD